MKNPILLLSVLVMIASCDTPQRTRAPQSYLSDPYTATTAGTTSGVIPPIVTTPATTSGSTTGTTTTPGFENCDLTANKGYAVDIGNVGFCQSTQDETTVKFRPTLTSSIRTCLIPTYRDASGASTYIGNPQCTLTTANTVIQGKLYKDRSGFTNYPLNGIIFMKEPLLPEYIKCMHGYVNWPGNACPATSPRTSYCDYWVPNCPYGGRTSPACDAEARNYMANVCSTFKSKYSNAYIDMPSK